MALETKMHQEAPTSLFLKFSRLFLKDIVLDVEHTTHGNIMMICYHVQNLCPKLMAYSYYWSSRYCIVRFKWEHRGIAKVLTSNFLSNNNRL